MWKTFKGATLMIIKSCISASGAATPKKTSQVQLGVKEYAE